MPNTGPEFAHAYLMHRTPLLEVLEQIPADKSDFAAWEGGMSFHRLTDHLSASSLRMDMMLQGQTPGKIEPTPDFSQALERLRASTQSANARLNNLTGEQLSTVIEVFGGRKMPVAALVDFLIQHEAHHKGQIWMMARMIGLQPPMFVQMG